MLVYAGNDGDDPASRAAKLKALQAIFAEPGVSALAMLAADALSKANAQRGTRLVINSHGNQDTFADMTPDQFYAELVSKGFQNGAFQALYLVACNVGQQNQRGAIVGNFARDLDLLFKQQLVDIALYAPRGVVSYTLQTVTQRGESFKKVTAIVIRAPEKDYSFKEGMLRVMA